MGGVTLAVTALTTFVLASIHAQTEGARWATWPIVGRNALLVVLGGWALWRLWSGARAARAEQPATASPSA